MYCVQLNNTSRVKEYDFCKNAVYRKTMVVKRMQVRMLGLLQYRRLHLATGTFFWPEQRCQIICIFCYFRLPRGNRKVALARTTLPIPLFFWNFRFPYLSGLKMAKHTKELVTLLWPEQLSCCPRAI